MRKKLLCILTAAIVAGSLSTGIHAETWYSNANLNIREGPGKDNKKVGKYLRDEEVNVLEYHKDGWSKTDKGYVDSRYLSRVKGGYPTSDSSRIVSSDVKEVDFPLSYDKNDVSITVSREFLFGSVCYCAHVVLPKENQLETVFAGNGWGDHETASEADSKIHSVLMVNGDYRDKNYGASVGIIRNGKVINNHVFDERGCGLTSEGDLVKIEGMTPSEAIGKGIVNTWEFGPILIDGGEIVAPAEEQKHPRTFIGQVNRDDDKNEYWIIVADGRQAGYSYGLTNLEMAKIMKQKECDFAVNLDGGGSSTMLFQGKLLNSPSDGQERRDADFLYVGVPE